VGIGTDDPPGIHPLRIDFTTDAGSKGSLNAQANVLPTAWTVDSVTVSTKLAALLDPRVQADEANFLAGVYSQVTNEKLWADGWLQPVGGGVTTRFGDERSYNGAPLAGHHSGTDIGAAEGVPVAATNNGRVVLARQLRLRGNMVVVDHGGGLFSGYAHLSSFAVAEGQAVETGETVGYVGSTGLSTGAHLHWEMATGGVVVDAFRFLDGTNGF
jgi:murein DD-endopeptidase MepM/ murein hydrolase activator NlpD